MNNHDAISLAKLAHSCQHMGAISLAKLCLTLEQHGHENNLAESNERLAPLTCEEERVATAFYDEVTKISSAHLSFNIATAYHRNINDASFSRLQSTLFVPQYLNRLLNRFLNMAIGLWVLNFLIIRRHIKHISGLI